MSDEMLCQIAFQAEAHDSAAHVYRQLNGWTVDVYPADGEKFTAVVGTVIVDPDDGQHRVYLRKWDEETHGVSNIVVLKDIYNDIDRIEVL